MKTLTILSIYLLVSVICNAQSIEKFSIDSGGDSSTSGNLQILYTIGEVNVAEYNTVSTSVSEGFINGYLSSTLGLEDNGISKYNIIIYPNPTSGIINIESVISPENVEIYDVLGKQVLESTFMNSINVSSLANGIYFIKLNINQKSIVRRIVVNKH